MSYCVVAFLAATLGAAIVAIFTSKKRKRDQYMLSWAHGLLEAPGEDPDWNRHAGEWTRAYEADEL